MISLRLTAILCAALLIAQNPYAFAQQPQSGGMSQTQSKSYSSEQLDSLVAPVALYPDPILSQLLVASTYPLEVVEAGRWLKQHSSLKGQALADAVRQQKWDASVQALVALPDVLNRLDQNVSWTADLGNAFLAQEAGVMQAIQRLREKASNAGMLKSTPQQTVGTENQNGQNYITVQPASPDVVSIPQYNPEAVRGPAPNISLPLYVLSDGSGYCSRRDYIRCRCGAGRHLGQRLERLGQLGVERRMGKRQHRHQ